MRIINIEQRACQQNGGTMCDSCQRGWSIRDCQVGRLRYYAHKINSKDIMIAVKLGDIMYLKKALELYAPWKLNELEKLLVLI